MPTVTLKVSAEDLARIDEAAERARCTRSAFMRDAARSVATGVLVPEASLPAPKLDPEVAPLADPLAPEPGYVAVSALARRHHVNCGCFMCKEGNDG